MCLNLMYLNLKRIGFYLKFFLVYCFRLFYFELFLVDFVEWNGCVGC